MGASQHLTALSDVGLADEIVRLRDEIMRRCGLVRDDNSPAAKSLLARRRYALMSLSQAEGRLRAGGPTNEPANVPVVDDRRGPYGPPDYPTNP